MRPQRQTRSSISYAESDGDDGDGDFCAPPVARRRRQPDRECSSKSSPLKTSSNKKARPNPKERAEAMQLERAIRESLNDVKAETLATPSPPPFRPDPDAKPSIAFQCLLDVTYEEGRATSRASEEADVKDYSKQQQADAETMQQEAYDDDQSKHLEEDISDCVQNRSDADAEGTNPSSLHDEFHDSSYVSRIQETSTSDREDAEAAPPLSGDTEQARVRETSSAASAKKNGDSSSSTTSDELLLPVQSSTTLTQRRVVGLSRRFRPPSLHPYLTS